MVWYLTGIMRYPVSVTIVLCIIRNRFMQLAIWFVVCFFSFMVQSGVPTRSIHLLPTKSFFSFFSTRRQVAKDIELYWFTRSQRNIRFQWMLHIRRQSTNPTAGIIIRMTVISSRLSHSTYHANIKLIFPYMNTYFSAPQVNLTTSKRLFPKNMGMGRH